MEAGGALLARLKIYYNPHPYGLDSLWLGLKYNLSIEQICGILLFNVTIVQWHDGELKLLFNFVIAQMNIW